MATALRITIEFIALTRACRSSKKNKLPASVEAEAGSRMQPAIPGPLSARVALLQSPILSAQLQYPLSMTLHTTQQHTFLRPFTKDAQAQPQPLVNITGQIICSRSGQIDVLTTCGIAQFLATSSRILPMVSFRLMARALWFTRARSASQAAPFPATPAPILEVESQSLAAS